MSIVLGFTHKHLTFDDGRSCDGYFLYLGDQRKDVIGLATERVFISDAKIAGYSPAVDDELKVYYNRYGKVDMVELL